jgi:surface protein
MFYNCYSLTSIPLFNTAACTNMSYMFTNCYSLTSVPGLNLSAISSAVNITSFLGATSSLSKAFFTGLRYTLSVVNAKLSKAALELICQNLGVGSAATLTITTNPGVDAAVSKTICGTTAGSTTVTQTNTSSLIVGMVATGTGTPLTTAVACTFTDAGDLVGLTSHGLSNDDVVSFPSITTTTGLVINATYYVVSATTNTFQVSGTLGGTALALTNNGTGTLKYRAKIISIVTNTSVTFDRPMTATGSQTLSFRLLDTSQALLKGWTVTG